MRLREVGAEEIKIKCSLQKTNVYDYFAYISKSEGWPREPREGWGFAGATFGKPL